MNQRILIAAGGTGGHLYPAQALARDLKAQDSTLEILFAGSGLSGNRCFHKELFAFEDITSATPFQRKGYKALGTLFQGLRQSFALFKRFNPSVVIGFGSYHAFPLLLAATIKRIPIILFESNVSAGKVVRLFSRFALFSAVQFSQTAEGLRGEIVQVPMPLWHADFSCSSEEARLYFGLSPHKETFLIFGGSQGAIALNRWAPEALARLKATGSRDFQVLHLTGNAVQSEQVRLWYASHQIDACVKDFEENMPRAWKAATVAICRSGAATLAEQISCQVPAIFVPYPHGAEDHQTKNALIMEKEIGGGISLSESMLTGETLCAAIKALDLLQMRRSLEAFGEKTSRKPLSQLIYESFCS